MATDKNKSSRSTIPFKVNGEQLYTEFEKLVAIDILKIASAKGAIPNKPEDYDLKGDKGVYKHDDWVDLNEDNIFITIPTSSTPVA